MAEAALSKQAAGSGRSSASGVADWLALAATPVFAAMALVTEISAEDQPDFLCLSAHGSLPLNGMVLMYLLMAAFHLSPWLRLIGRRL